MTSVSGANRALVNEAATHPHPSGFDHGEGGVLRFTALADQCELATLPDRELDARIAVAVDFHARDSNPSSARKLHTDFGGSNSYSCLAKYWPRLPRYTTSLEDAMTLVPKGWHASTIIQDRWKPAFWFVCLRKPSGFEAHCKQKGFALSYAAAALRALAIEAGARSDETGTGSVRRTPERAEGIAQSTAAQPLSGASHEHR